MDLIDISDFKKLELIVGKIIEIQDINSSKPMYILKVNIGTEIRTIIAGIKDHYQKQDLLNKNVVVIANLKPKTIMGIESKGMLLIADDGTDISLVFPEKELKLGAKIE
ncbi:MAG: hypothetical protein QXP35_01900 [Candidatus Micrarchaeaceae archaeon]|nr:hypothetical protein [Candidatus Marsarchaeota archaeon]